MSDTPETDEAVKASNGQWSFVLKETCQRLERERNVALEQWELCIGLAKKNERERDKAREDATNYYARIGELESELDEAMEALSGRTVSCAACNHAAIERDEAREKAERYRLEANAMMLQRDELKKIVEQRILAGAEIHDKANSLLKQSNRTEAECEALRKQLTAATSALRQIHLEVGDWIRSTIIVEE